MRAAGEISILIGDSSGPLAGGASNQNYVINAAEVALNASLLVPTYRIVEPIDLCPSYCITRAKFTIAATKWLTRECLST